MFRFLKTHPVFVLEPHLLSFIGKKSFLFRSLILEVEQVVSVASLKFKFSTSYQKIPGSIPPVTPMEGLGDFCRLVPSEEDKECIFRVVTMLGMRSIENLS